MKILSSFLQQKLKKLNDLKAFNHKTETNFNSYNQKV